MVTSILSDKPIGVIARLHTNNEIDCDLTWGTGSIYKGTDIMPTIRIDQHGRGTINADLMEGIPLETASVRSIVFDPPFVVRRNWRKSNHYIFKRFGGYETRHEAQQFFYTVILDAHRVLKRYGILIVKIQDSSLKDGGTFWATEEIFSIAEACGFRAIDKFIEVAPVPKPLPLSVTKQKTARKIHCTWWVFKRRDLGGKR